MIKKRHTETDTNGNTMEDPTRGMTMGSGDDGLRCAPPILHKLVEAATILVLAGCVPIPPRPIPISDVPTITSTSCNVTFVRKKQLAGSAPSHFISLDKLTVASLEVGEYTTFPVTEGRHSLAVTWRVGDKLFGVGGFGAGAAALVWSPYTKSVELDCRPPVNYFFTITSKAFSLDENDRVELKHVEQLDGDFILERNRYIAPGSH
jgi:hypothetical protein